jgi:mRNA-degrading endonuclease RelE of RelBE toxin-antitoxin system
VAEVVTLRFSDQFRACYRRLPKHIQDQVDKALTLLKENPQHPSLHTKKMKATREVWEARISYSYRMTFVWEGDLIILRRVGAHDILKKET